jgi:Kazal-type serine protease inhibitor domain
MVKWPFVSAAVVIALLGAEAFGQPGKSCGSRGMSQCGAREFCNYPLRAQCGYTDLPGRCAANPKVCAKIFRPVCGCDRKTYSNACAANAAGVSVLHAGKC